MWLRRYIAMVSVIGLTVLSPAGAAQAIPEYRPGNLSAAVQIDRLRAKVKDLRSQVRRLKAEQESRDDLAVVVEPRPEPTTRESSGYGSPYCGAACIQCESGGDPQAVSSTGKYWGLYQFDYQTWVAHGGNPDSYGSAGASEQHAVASRITYDAWPNC